MNRIPSKMPIRNAGVTILTRSADRLVSVPEQRTSSFRAVNTLNACSPNLMFLRRPVDSISKIARTFCELRNFQPLTSMSVPLSPVTQPEGKAATVTQASNGGAPDFRRQSLRVIDISRKRRSGSCESIPTGRPFINPVDRLARVRPRRSFFRDVKEVTPKNGLRSTLAAVRGLTQAQAFRVALSLHLNPPTYAKLQDFVSSISELDEEMIDTVNTAIAGVVRVRNEGVVRPGIFEFFDYRYKSAGREDKSFKIGDVPLDFHFPVPETEHHVVLQCFANGTPPVFRWPLSLRVFVNGRYVKLPGRFMFPLIDLTAFGVGADVRIVYDVDGGMYTLMLREATFESYRDMVMKIENEKAVNDNFNELETSVLSPMSGKLLKHPGRGRNCKHAQCFDLLEFLKIATSTQMWACPVCRTPTYPEDLVSSAQMRRILYDMKPVRPLAVAEPAPNSDADQRVKVSEDRAEGGLGWLLFEGKDEDEWQFGI